MLLTMAWLCRRMVLHIGIGMRCPYMSQACEYLVPSWWPVGRIRKCSKRRCATEGRL